VNRVVEAPGPVRDLDWDPKRARGFADRTADLWQELLERLRSEPVAEHRTSEQVRDAVALPVPDAPMPEDEIFEYLHDVVFRWSTFPGHPRFMAYVCGRRSPCGRHQHECRRLGAVAERHRDRDAPVPLVRP
jgi:hypothetical protein